MSKNESKKTIKFGTDGWRGILADDFTFDNVKIVTRAIGEYIKNNSKQEKIVIAHDARFLGEELTKISSLELSKMGITSLIFDRPMPTPITAFAIKETGAAGAIMFTASHNPPEYQGIKFIADYGGPANTDITRSIEGAIGGNGQSVKGDYVSAKDISVTDEYWKHLGTLIDFDLIKKGGLSVMVDPMYGAGAGLLSGWLKGICREVNSIHDYFDPNFGGHNPDPGEEGLSDLTADTIARNADAGLALDGDGDRFGIIDSLGVYLSPNQIISLLAHYLFSKRGFKGRVARTVATTHLLDDIANDLGDGSIETPVGFKWICKEMLGGDIVIGGEESGGLSIKGHIPEKDGILACLLVLEMLAEYKREPLSKILENIHDKYGKRYGIRLDLRLSEERKKEVLDRFTNDPPAEIEGVSVMEVRTVDGIKLVLEDGDWILIRPSGTEPLVRVYIESKSPERFSVLEKYSELTIK